MPIPASIDAERALLGALIAKSQPWPEGLLPSHFADPSHQDIASAVLSLIEQGKTPDEITVTETLRSIRSPVPGAKVSSITDGAEYRAYSSTWAEEIRKMASLRTLAAFADKLKHHASDASSDPDALLAFAEGTIKSVGTTRQKVGPQLMPLADLERFDRKADPDNVLGNRWLCRGGSLVMAGQAGTGKSALMMQAAINWTLGRDFFGIRTKDGRKLRTIAIQAENDAGDVGEAMQDQISGLMLTDPEVQVLRDNLFLYRESVNTGENFGKVLRDLVNQHQADIVFVDPLMAYVGADISEAKEAARFLRHIIQPILNETGVIIVFMHHTGKPKSSKDKEGQTVADLAYNLFGSSEVTNWAREIACLIRCPGDEPIYKLGLTKRRTRAGMLDFHNNPSGEIYIRHSPQRGVIRWVPCTKPVEVNLEGY